MTVNAITTQVVINGNQIPIIGWHTDCGSQGGVSTFQMDTSLVALKATGYNLVSDLKQNSQLPVSLFILINGVKSLVFKGVLDSIEPEFHEDLITFHGRDNAALLIDQEQALSKDLYFNQTVGQIVTQIAQNYGFTPQVTDPGVLAGTLYTPSSGAEYAFSDKPRPLWKTLQLFAKQTGYDCYVTPKNVLYFGPPGGGAGNHIYYWRPPFQTSTSIEGCIDLTITQQSRRCSNFTVNVWSYDHNHKQKVSASVTDGDGSGTTYNVHRNGLTTDQCQMRAKSIASDIKQKEIVARAVVDGDPNVNVGDQIQFLEYNSGDLIGYSGIQFFITSCTQSFEMPQHESTESAGFLTHIIAQQYVPAGGD